MSPLERFRYIRSLRGIPSSAKSLLFVLASHANREGICWPGRPLLAAETGLSIRTVATGLAWLAAHGLIIRRFRPGASNTYALTLDQFKAATQATTALPPRQPLPTEVANVKVKPRRNRARLIYPTPRNVVSLFPESQAKARQ